MREKFLQVLFCEITDAYSFTFALFIKFFHNFPHLDPVWPWIVHEEEIHIFHLKHLQTLIQDFFNIFSLVFPDFSREENRLSFDVFCF